MPLYDEVNEGQRGGDRAHHMFGMIIDPPGMRNPS